MPSERQFMSYADPEEDLGEETMEVKPPKAGLRREAQQYVGERFRQTPGTPLDIATEDERERALGVANTTKRVVHEMTKSFGMRYDETNQNWDFDVDNVKKAWDESPGWTLFDWATAAFGPAKLGKAAMATRRGKGVAGQTIQAAREGDVYAQELLSKGPTTGPTRLLGRFTSPEYARAVELQMASPAKSRVGRFIQSPASIDPDYIKAAEAVGGTMDPGVSKAIVQAGRHQVDIAANMAEVLQRRVAEGTKHFTEATSKRFHTVLKGETLPEAGELAAEFGEKGAEALRQTWDFRNSLTERALELGLLDETAEATMRAEQGRYLPKLYEEFQQMEKTRGARLAGMKGQEVLSATHGKGSAFFSERRVLPEGFVPEELTALWDPNATVEALATSSHYVANQQFAQNLAKSALAADTPEILQQLASMTPDMAKLHSHDPSVIRRAASLIEDGITSGPEVDDLMKQAGWKTFREYVGGAGKLPEYARQLERSGLLDKRIDPHAIEELDNMFRFTSETPGLTTALRKGGRAGLSTFRVSKTAYNPATHVRNTLGNVVFHHWATGKPKLVPAKGLSAFKAQGDDYMAAIEAGILDSGDMEIVTNIMKEIHGDDIANAHHLDWMGEGPVRDKLKAAGKWTEELYRAEDAVWKLDAFIENRAKYTRAGMTAEQATEQAVVDIVKFMPTFNRNSEFGHLLGKTMPFANFTTEAARVGKNAMAEKPHLALFWSNFADASSQAVAAMEGYSMDEVQQFREGVPGYDQQNLMTWLPFEIDGAPAALDLGYIIPLADTVSGAHEPQTLFGLRPLAGSNPYVNTMAAALTGTDPFAQRELQPKMTDKYIGPVEGEAARRTIGLAEYMLQQVMPPLTPVIGSAGRNIGEAITGEVHPQTGEPMEDHLGRTVAANLFGLRTVQASPDSVRRNIKADKQRLESRRTAVRRVMQQELAQGEPLDMVEAKYKQRILDLTTQIGEVTGDTVDPEKYYKRMMKTGEPGALRTEETKILRETLRRTEKGPYTQKGRAGIQRRVEEVEK